MNGRYSRRIRTRSRRSSGTCARASSSTSPTWASSATSSRAICGTTLSAPTKCSNMTSSWSSTTSSTSPPSASWVTSDVRRCLSSTNSPARFESSLLFLFLVLRRLWLAPTRSDSLRADGAATIIPLDCWNWHFCALCSLSRCTMLSSTPKHWQQPKQQPQ